MQHILRDYKSTTLMTSDSACGLHMQMIGLQMPSYGTAYIDGMDLRKDMDEIYANIGVCPQHEYDHN